MTSTFYQDNSCQILCGDVLAMLGTLPDEYVQMVVTSPPYWGLRDYGVEGQIGLEKTPHEYVEKMVAVFREVRRVLKNDGTLWLNLGDSYASGFTGRNDSNRETPGGRGGSFRGGERKSLDINSGLKPKDLVGIPWRVAFALQADGWYLRSDIIWHKPNPMPESVMDRPTKAHEYLFLFTKSERYFYDHEAIRETCITDPRAREKFNGESAVDTKRRGSNSHCGTYLDGRNKRSVWTVSTQPYPEAHFATFPPKLIEPCILAGSRAGDVVLDPFSGSGTTCAVVRDLGRKGIGIELNKSYCALAVERLRQEVLKL